MPLGLSRIALSEADALVGRVRQGVQRLERSKTPQKKEKTQMSIGEIKFGKSRPDRTKYVKVDIEMSDETGDQLYKLGLIALKHDREAVIEYVFKKALLEMCKR